jgi:hypothetical protein
MPRVARPIFSDEKVDQSWSLTGLSVPLLPKPHSRDQGLVGGSNAVRALWYAAAVIFGGKT